VIRPTVATVSLAAIQHNLAAIRALVARESEAAPRPAGATNGPGVIAVEGGGASMLACADIAEGVSLREAGISAPILVFGALSVSDLDGVFDHRLTPTVSTPAAARALEDAARRRGVVVRCHLKIDTGMNRLGFRHDNLGRTIPGVLASNHLRFDAVYTHFATADDPESPFLEEQRTRFERARSALAAMGLGRIAAHAANSAALLRDRRAWYDWIRPGLLLYGIVPPPLGSTLDLHPALSLTSRVVAVKGLRAGEGTSYGLRWRADGPHTIAIVPAGYADGLDTRLSGRGHALIGGRRLAIVGAVCMDMLMVDVTGLDVNPGDEVVFIGRQGDETITAREVAAAIGSIPWEVVCRLGSRIERVYASSEK
jgi:alanine racemase